MSVKITDINIACDAALDQDVIQEIGFLGEQERIDFFSYEEQKEFLESHPIDPLFALSKQETLMDHDLENEMYINELMEKGAREAFGVCEWCNGTGSYLDCNPHNSRMVPCEDCNGTGFINNKEGV